MFTMTRGDRLFTIKSQPGGSLLTVFFNDTEVRFIIKIDGSLHHVPNRKHSVDLCDYRYTKQVLEEWVMWLKYNGQPPPIPSRRYPHH
jgi:hypothetical protein